MKIKLRQEFFLSFLLRFPSWKEYLLKWLWKRVERKNIFAIFVHKKYFLAEPRWKGVVCTQKVPLNYDDENHFRKPEAFISETFMHDVHKRYVYARQQFSPALISQNPTRCRKNKSSRCAVFFLYAPACPVSGVNAFPPFNRGFLHAAFQITMVNVPNYLAGWSRAPYELQTY